MEELLASVAEIWRATGAVDEVRLIGGLAVRLHVGTHARRTRDIDIVAMDQEWRQRLVDEFSRSGYAVGNFGTWWRIAKPGQKTPYIDLAEHPVVNPATFDSISLFESPHVVSISGTRVALAGVHDMVRLKLVAGRDQDLVDLMLLTSMAEISAKDIAKASEADDSERAVSAGVQAARYALRTILLREIVEETLDRNPTEDEIARLRLLLDALNAEGL